MNREELLGQLAEEYCSRLRRGEAPTIAEYAERYPELAEELEEVLATLDWLEGAGSAAKEETAGVPEQLGDYRIEREIGRGGMGIVYDAEQISLGRRVALKVLPVQATLDPRFLQRFRREAEAVAGLQHPHIVPVYGVGEDRGIHYFTMQKIDGQGLDRVLRRVWDQGAQALRGSDDDSREALRGYCRDQLTAVTEIRRTKTHLESEAEPVAPSSAATDRSPTSGVRDSTAEYYRIVARLIRNVADALSHAHNQGILHRDVKPSNLLLDREGKVWVTDFGLCKTSDSDDLTEPGALVGTLRYMSPERLSGDSDIRGDVYGVGVTLYELLTLTPAFDGTARSDLIHAVLERDPLPPSKLDPGIPKDLEVIVLKCLRKNPDERYATTAELRDELDAFLAGRPISARAPSLGYVLKLAVKRNKGLVATILTSVCILITVTIVSILYLLEAYRQADSRYDQIVQITSLSDRDLILEEAQLAQKIFPAVPANVPAMEKWVKDVEDLVSRRSVHAATLTELRRSAIASPDSVADELSATGWEFEDAEVKWHHDSLVEILQRLDQFVAPEDRVGTLQEMRRRIALAQDMAQMSTGAHQDSWDQAVASIANRSECPMYEGRTIAPQTGLVPVGRDPESGLWEFSHILSGDIVKRDAEGKLQLEGGAGLVFVLIPGGTFRMGTHKTSHGLTVDERDGKLFVHEVIEGSFSHQCGVRSGDQIVSIDGGATQTLRGLERAMNGLQPGKSYPLLIERGGRKLTLQFRRSSDPLVFQDSLDFGPCHEVTLAPFFLSKYEMTQGQWLRATGENPSRFKPGFQLGGRAFSWLSPVEKVSWQRCYEVMSRLELRLPTEAQWEFAARAGSTTEYFCGDDPRCLEGYANLADVYAWNNGFKQEWAFEDWLDDGHLAHAPVGSYRPNPFGLHDIVGNVWEWCLEPRELYYLPVQPVTGERRGAGGPIRICRGGSWFEVADTGRSGARDHDHFETPQDDIGLRPARMLIEP